MLDNSNINTNWTLFTNLLIEKHAHPLPIIKSANSLDLEIRNFTDDLLAAHKNSSKPYSNRNNWIHPNVKKLIKIRNNVKKKRNPNVKTILNRINKNIKKAFKDYSDKLWEEKLEDLPIDDGSFWNLTKNFKSSKTKIPPSTVPFLLQLKTWIKLDSLHKISKSNFNLGQFLIQSMKTR
ncbi:hypothetical protein CDAR_593141 [Caerostris darwini]|uniref:Uncharacterized protein n=1 Tax=Caerostris darwini TaxID=1538125 RepID=A0AAV4TXD8_9ARAC|nr:hypothetical protein CDAR_593141 [Caerostris darwini]